jgi:glucose-6-phosphate isomerase
MSFLFTYDKSLVPPAVIKTIIQELSPEIYRYSNMRIDGYREPMGFINAPFDEKYIKKVRMLAQEKKAFNPKLFLLIGIGGSNLGVLAVHEAIHGKYYNDTNPDMKFYCADTLDADKIVTLKKLVEHLLQEGDQVIIAVVSKSGTTTETTANAAIFIELLKKHRPDNYQKFLVFITDKGSPLWQLSKELESSCLEVPEQIGGRFSVFTAVGLFPLALLGIDIELFSAGAQEAVLHSVLYPAISNNTAMSAAILWHHYTQGIYVHDTFFFDEAFESVGKWYRQLMAESLGKDGKGMLPTVSIGTIDLHSMTQFYLGGRAMSLTTFIAPFASEDCTIPKSKNTEGSGMLVNLVAEAIFKGTEEAYAKMNRPFMSITALRKGAYDLGYLLQLKMVEIVYLGYLMRVNPFDQPQVELYKSAIRRNLQNK